MMEHGRKGTLEQGPHGMSLSHLPGNNCLWWTFSSTSCVWDRVYQDGIRTKQNIFCRIIDLELYSSREIEIE